MVPPQNLTISGDHRVAGVWCPPPRTLPLVVITGWPACGVPPQNLTISGDHRVAGVWYPPRTLPLVVITGWPASGVPPPEPYH